jgi:beta-xylosidase
MPTRPAWVDAGEAEIWAPSVARIGTRFVLYFAAHHAGATTDERNDLCIGRAVSTGAMGPYAPEASPIYCGLPAEGAVSGQPASNRFGRGALDPEVFRAPDGKLYLLVALSRTRNNIASVPLKSDGRPTGGLNTPASILASQSMPWHDGRDDGVLSGGFLENPSMLYDAHTKTYLLFFSAGQWSTTYYNVSFARCGKPTGECVQDTRGPFLKTGNGRAGPGGLTAYISNAGQPRVAYASWTQGHESPSSNPAGIYSRQTHWALLRLSATTDPAQQSVSLG